MKQHKLKPFISDLVFGEGPRWRDSRLWFSDIKDRKILSADIQGTLRVEHSVPFQPSGLGWLPDGRLLVTSMADHCLMRCDNGDFTVVAELGKYCGGHLNDMVVDAQGHAYIGNIGFDLTAEPFQPRPTVLLRVDPDGSEHVVAEDVWCPNGMAITEDGKTLIVGQSAAPDLLAFDIDDSGNLSNRCTYTSLPEGAAVDGMCLDAEGAIWAASPTTDEVLRLMPGGGVSERVDTGGQRAIACVLGGEDRRTLFVITNDYMSLEKAAKARAGSIGVVTVDVPGVGRP